MPVIPKKKKINLEMSPQEKSKIIRLKILNEQIIRCKKCPRLRPNGMAIPYWTKKSKYLGLAEGPGKVEVEEKTPLIGPAGDIFIKGIKEIGFKREDFVILNSVQCRPVVGKRNGKPTFDEMINCRFWVNKYVEVSRPEKILAMGNYAVYSLFGTGNSLGGITASSGKFIGNYANIPVYACIHPASLLYNDDNKILFKKSLKNFKEA